jgi:serine/threonine-protein kinase
MNVQPKDVPTPHVPLTVLRKIRNAWIAGVIAAAGTLIVGMLTLFIPNAGISYAWQAGEFLFLCSMTFGIYKKSRVCAALMLTYLIVGKLLLWLQGTFDHRSLVPVLVFCYFFAEGVRGTLAYHRIRGSA